MIYQTRLALRSNHSMSFLAEHRCSVVRGCFCVLISDWESFGIVVKYGEVTFCVMRSRSRCRTDSLALKKSLCPSFARPALVCWIILGRCTCPNINQTHPYSMKANSTCLYVLYRVWPPNDRFQCLYGLILYIICIYIIYNIYYIYNTLRIKILMGLMNVFKPTNITRGAHIVLVAAQRFARLAGPLKLLSCLQHKPAGWS